jgi:predicted lipoprotein with Yx(FWY)xxD motif
MSRVEGAVRKAARWGAPIGAALVLCATALAQSTTVTTHQTKRGKDLAAANGRALYLFTADKAGSSACNGSCAATWKPLLASGRPAAARGSGLTAKLLGTIRRANHSLQVVYNGHPLYEFAGDTKAGQIGGQGANEFGGHWYIVNTSGHAVKPKASGGGNLCNPICQGY